MWVGYCKRAYVVPSDILGIDNSQGCYIINGMFIRAKTTPNSPRKSVQICETYRKDGRVKQKIVHHVGIAFDATEEKKLKDYALELMAKILVKREKEQKQQSLLPLDEETVKSGYRLRRGRPRKKKLEDIVPVKEVNLEDIVEESRITEGTGEVAGKMFEELYGELKLPKRVKSIIKFGIDKVNFPCK